MTASPARGLALTPEAVERPAVLCAERVLSS